jgi:hypothetical protein
MNETILILLIFMFCISTLVCWGMSAEHPSAKLTKAMIVCGSLFVSLLLWYILGVIVSDSGEKIATYAIEDVLSSDGKTTVQIAIRPGHPPIFVQNEFGDIVISKDKYVIHQHFSADWGLGIYFGEPVELFPKYSLDKINN